MLSENLSAIVINEIQLFLHVPVYELVKSGLLGWGLGGEGIFLADLTISLKHEGFMYSDSITWDILDDRAK